MKMEVSLWKEVKKWRNDDRDFKPILFSAEDPFEQFWSTVTLLNPSSWCCHRPLWSWQVWCRWRRATRWPSCPPWSCSIWWGHGRRFSLPWTAFHPPQDGQVSFHQNRHGFIRSFSGQGPAAGSFYRPPRRVISQRESEAGTAIFLLILSSQALLPYSKGDRGGGVILDSSGLESSLLRQRSLSLVSSSSSLSWAFLADFSSCFMLSPTVSSFLSMPFSWPQPAQPFSRLFELGLLYSELPAQPVQPLLFVRGHLDGGLQVHPAPQSLSPNGSLF